MEAGRKHHSVMDNDCPHEAGSTDTANTMCRVYTHLDEFVFVVVVVGKCGPIV